MKILNTKQSVTIPEGVEASVKARVVTIKGPRGTLDRSFRHLAIDIFMPDKNTITVKSLTLSNTIVFSSSVLLLLTPIKCIDD